MFSPSVFLYNDKKHSGLCYIMYLFMYFLFPLLECTSARVECICFLGLLPQITTNLWLKTTEIFPHHSGGQKL